jgi:hypothetical protein
MDTRTAAAVTLTPRKLASIRCIVTSARGWFRPVRSVRADLVDLLADDERARQQLALTQSAYAQLIAAARAGVAAELRGDPDAWLFVRHLLAARGQLPSAGAVPEQLLADARTNLSLAATR